MRDLFPVPTLLSQGVHRQSDGSVEWCVWAPFCERLNLVTWPQGVRRDDPMEKASNGYFVARRDSAQEGLQYAFLLPDGQQLPDPASRWQPEGVHQPSAVLFPEDFDWSDSSWRGVRHRDLVIYELHVGTFTPEGTLDAVVARLPELVELGITAIELMPVAQFPRSRNWGYDGVHAYAVQNSYGGPRALQRLVNAAHDVGLAVFLDVIYNHLGPEGNYLGRFGPYFTDQHHTPWGPAINYYGPDSDAVRKFVTDNACYWVREFHIDGLRLDAVQTIYDLGPQHILEELQTRVQEVARQMNREVQVIAETNQNDVRLIRSRDAGGYALDGVWADDLHHSIHALLTGEDDGWFADFGRPEHVCKAYQTAFVYDGCHSRFRRRRHGSSPQDLDGEKFVVCIQNHDQVGNRVRGERNGTLLSPSAQRLAASLLLVSPYTPLLFMGEEYGETRPFAFFSSFLEPSLNDAVRAGRLEGFAACEFELRGEPHDPSSPHTFSRSKLSWSWPDGTIHAGLRRLYRDMLAARRAWPPLHYHAAPLARLVGPECEPSTSGSKPLLMLEYPSESRCRVLANLTTSVCHCEPATAPDALRLFSSEEPRYAGSLREEADDVLLGHELRVYGPAEWRLWSGRVKSRAT